MSRHDVSCECPKCITRYKETHYGQGTRKIKHWLDKYGALQKLQNFDLAHETSLVREIEMAVDGLSPNRLRVSQFFEDFRVYGFAEAILYLKEILGKKQLETLNKLHEKVLKEVETTRVKVVYKDGSVCGECGKTVTEREYSSGESACCKAEVVAEEFYAK